VTLAGSVSAPVRAVVDANLREGTVLGRGHVLVDGYVVSLVPLRGPRMPNGIECDLHVQRGERLMVGGGGIGGVRVAASTPVWDPVPRPRVALRTATDIRIDVEALAGRGPGLTPAGDDVLAGYAAGLALFHGRTAEAAWLAERAAPRTNALSATLLRHAARGELPEPAHVFLERGDPEPLLAWGHSSGRCLALGLALAFGDERATRMRSGKNGYGGATA
jgi:hypothetical protein